MPPATLMNCFEVPSDEDDAFLALWHQADELLRSRGAYATTRLHKSLIPQSRFRFINVAELPSVDVWRSVIQEPEFGAISAQMARFHPTPGLYAVEVANAAHAGRRSYRA